MEKIEKPTSQKDLQFTLKNNSKSSILVNTNTNSRSLSKGNLIK